MHSTGYIIKFVGILTAIVAIVLAGLFSFFKPLHIKNEALSNKKAILMALENQLGKKVSSMRGDEVINLFDQRVKQYALDSKGQSLDSTRLMSLGYVGGRAEDINMAKEKKKAPKDRVFPLFVYKDKAGKNYYIISVRGSGLWDEIWGSIALEDDFNTIAGASFDHKGETPGLGAEIKDNPGFSAMFKGKKIYDDRGNFKSVLVKKGKAQDPNHEVDGISGATLTGNGVTEMLASGFKYYEPYFNKLKSKN